MGIISDASFAKLEEALSELVTALAVVRCYGIKDGPDLDPFDLAVNESIKRAANVAERLSSLLSNARTDIAIERVEFIRAQQQKQSDLERELP